MITPLLPFFSPLVARLNLLDVGFRPERRGEKDHRGEGTSGNTSGRRPRRDGDQRVAKAIGRFEHKPKDRPQQPRCRTYERRQQRQHEETAGLFFGLDAGV